MDAIINDILRRKGYDAHGVPPDATVAEAAAAMRTLRVGAMLVMQSHSLLGLLSEGDVVRRVVAQGLDPKQIAAANVMSTPVQTVRGETTIHEAMALASATRCRHLPVVDDGQLRGVISAGDLMAWTVGELRREVGELNAYIHGPGASLRAG
jgi:CBS domain-containing protein